MRLISLTELQGLVITALRRLFAPLTLFVWFAISLATALAGPFGSFENDPLSERLMFWGSLIGIAVTIAYVLRVVIRGLCPVGPFRADAIFLATTTIVTSLVLDWYVHIWTYDKVEIRPSFLELMFYVLLCTLAVVFARLLLPGYEYSFDDFPSSSKKPQIDEEDSVSGPERWRLHRRTELPEDAQLLRLSAKDHMVTVVTSKGDCTLRMRFSDAIDEAEPVEGFCTHRSHWVARDAVCHSREVDGKPQLVLVNGDAIPVSRKYHGTLLEAGFFK